MMLVLTCTLCFAAPDTVNVAPVDRLVLLDQQLSIPDARRAPPGAFVPVPVRPMPDRGSGGGDDHSGHMGPMWIVMGAMMVVMMVGMGLYFMNHGARGQALEMASVPSPAKLAIPVSGPRGGG